MEYASLETTPSTWGREVGMCMEWESNYILPSNQVFRKILFLTLYQQGV